MTGLQAASVYIAVNILILVWLALRVVSRRFKGKISIGDGGSEDLAIAIRVHGNASEYIPPMLIGLLGLALMDGAVPVIHALGIAFTVARLSHVLGMSRGPIVARQLGILVTWASMVILSLALLYHAFN